MGENINKFKYLNKNKIKTSKQKKKSLETLIRKYRKKMKKF